MDDIVTRLRLHLQLRFMAPSKISGETYQMVPPQDLDEAADRIDELELALDSAVAILRGEVGSGWADRNQRDWEIIDAALNHSIQKPS